MSDIFSTEPIKTELEAAISITAVAKDAIDKSSWDPTPRLKLSSALFLTAFEHATSILILVRESHVGSALALMRPAHEALRRGVWLAYAATDRRIAGIAADRDRFPGYKEMEAAINSACPFEDLVSAINAVQSVYENRSDLRSENHLHDFTHGGIFQISQHISPGVITPTFDRDLIQVLLHTARVLISGSALAIVALSEDDEYFEAVADSLTKFINCGPDE